jgi:hypothetical protein
MPALWRRGAVARDLGRSIHGVALEVGTASQVGDHSGRVFVEVNKGGRALVEDPAFALDEARDLSQLFEQRFQGFER